MPRVLLIRLAQLIGFVNYFIKFPQLFIDVANNMIFNYNWHNELLMIFNVLIYN